MLDVYAVSPKIASSRVEGLELLTPLVTEARVAAQISL